MLVHLFTDSLQPSVSLPTEAETIHPEYWLRLLPVATSSSEELLGDRPLRIQIQTKSQLSPTRECLRLVKILILNKEQNN